MIHSRTTGCCMLAILTGFLLAAGNQLATAQRQEAKPDVLEGVGVTEHPNAQLPLDLEFVDSDGKKVRLGQNMPWKLGDEFRVVTISIDPLETADRARLTKQKYLKEYARPGSADGWHFLVGPEENIKRVADTVGFGYRYVGDQYVHAAASFICTPEGRVSRYIYRVDYDPQTLRLSLYEAAQGKVGSTVDRVLLFCFHYDPQSGRYGMAAANMMRLGGVLTVIIVGGVLSLYWLRERRKAKRARSESPS
jgi:protein SCO1/2